MSVCLYMKFLNSNDFCLGLYLNFVGKLNSESLISNSVSKYFEGFLNFLRQSFIIAIKELLNEISPPLCNSYWSLHIVLQFNFSFYNDSYIYIFSEVQQQTTTFYTLTSAYDIMINKLGHNYSGITYF